MSQKTSAANAKEFRTRWAMVNAATDEEYRRMPISERVRQFFELMDQAYVLDWKTKDEAEVEIVRERWRKLHEAYGI